MDHSRIVNELLIYSGTLMVAVVLFAFIAVSFVGVVVVALLARLAQWFVARSVAAAVAYVAGRLRHTGRGRAGRPPTSAVPLT